MKAFSILVVAFIAIASAKRVPSDYYWRDFKGQVPNDALKVAQNGSDVPVYIGQGYFEGVGILPGMLQEGDMEMSAVADGRVVKTKDIKIMATSSKHRDNDFQWISINYQNLHNLGELGFLELINGGTESNTMVYIGRHSEPGFTNIGKIYTLEPYQGLTMVDANGKITVYKNFEVLAMLTFDCDAVEDYFGQSNQNSRSTYYPKPEYQSHRSSRVF